MLLSCTQCKSKHVRVGFENDTRKRNPTEK